jgi:hypothetical protein
MGIGTSEVTPWRWICCVEQAGPRHALPPCWGVNDILLWRGRTPALSMRCARRRHVPALALPDLNLTPRQRQRHLLRPPPGTAHARI